MDKRAYAQMEQRAGDRRVLRVPGAVWFAGQAPMELRTIDASPGGVGVRHESPFPPAGTRGKLRLQLMVDTGPVRVEADIEVRYSCMSGGAYRSGLQFCAMDPRDLKLLAGVLATRPLVLEAQ
jgi:hypothetical protein